MINYTDQITGLMRDIVARVPALSFITPEDVLVFGRFGRSGADGPFATCHCLSLPPSEPGYYFWRDRRSGRLTRRSEWFVTKSPRVSVESRPVHYLISFALPRFCDQTLARSRKRSLYPGREPWVGKLDTVVHELYHIAPSGSGLRRMKRADGRESSLIHSPEFFADVAEMVNEYLDSKPDPEVCAFLRHDFASLEARYGGVIGTTFRTFPSFPQRYVERLVPQPEVAHDESADEDLVLERLRLKQVPTCYTEADLSTRQFMRSGVRQVGKKQPRRTRVARSRAA
jgi:hypothetical protein